MLGKGFSWLVLEILGWRLPMISQAMAPTPQLLLAVRYVYFV